MHLVRGPGRIALSLVERLVVLAVRGVLTSMFWPALRSALEKASRGRDASNCGKSAQPCSCMQVRTAVASRRQAARSHGTARARVDAPRGRARSRLLSETRAGFSLPRGIPRSWAISSAAGHGGRGTICPGRSSAHGSAVENHPWQGGGCSRNVRGRQLRKDDYAQSPAFDVAMHAKLAPAIGVLFADGHGRECAQFDPASMTTEYPRGCWYSF